MKFYSGMSVEFLVSLRYMAFSAAWILFSDYFLFAFVTSPQLITQIQTYKGWFFVGISTLLIYTWIHRLSIHKQSIQNNLDITSEKYRLLYESSLDAILLTSPDGKILAANPAACQLFDRTEAEICQLGQAGIFDISDPRLPIALEERARTSKFLGELTFVRKTGEKFPCQISSAIFIDKNGQAQTSIIIREITAIKKSEKIIQQQLSEIASYYDNAPIGLAVLDTNLRFLRINKMLADINGVSAEAHIGKSVSEIVPSLEAQARQVLDQILLTNKAITDVEISGYTSAEPKIRHTWLEGWYPLFDNNQKLISIIVMVQDITERKRAQEELLNSHKQLRELTSRLAETEQKERSLLSRELHDRVGQTLTALNINLSIVQAQLSEESRKKVGSRVEEAIQLVEETVDHVRDVMADLHPPVLADYGILATLRWYAEKFTKLTGIPVSVNDSYLCKNRLPYQIEIVLYRVAQEALNNIVHHADAKEVSINLVCDNQRIKMYIQDDGKGFDMYTPIVSDDNSGWGIRIMRERIEALGGSFDIKSTSGLGTEVCVEISFQTDN